MNYKEARLKSITPQAIWHDHGFVVVNDESGNYVESAHSFQRATAIAEQFMEHEIRCGRTTKYRVETLDK
jgi:hypothetical protein